VRAELGRGGRESKSYFGVLKDSMLRWRVHEGVNGSSERLHQNFDSC
jgi:hypothetical protein